MEVTHVRMGHSSVEVTHMWRGHSCGGVILMWSNCYSYFVNLFVQDIFLSLGLE